MKKIFLLTVLFIVTGFLFLNSLLFEQNQKPSGRMLEAAVTGIKGAVKPDLDFGRIPLYFVTNQGQAAREAKFYARASRYTLWLTKEGLVFDSTRKGGNPKSETRNSKQIKNSNFQNSKQKQVRLKADELTNLPTNPLTDSSTLCERDVSRLLFIGANKNPEIVPLKKSKLKVNYFIGSDKSKWHCDVPTSAAVLYKDIYKNIDLKVYGIEKQVEYDWIIKPGGNPADIRFVYKNVKGTHFDEQGNLVIDTKFGEMIHKKPVSYQEGKVQCALTHPAPLSGAPPCKSGGGEFCVGAQRAVPEKVLHIKTHSKEKRIQVDVKFKKTGKNTYGFAVGEYDKNRELIIDPVVLVYSTYLGGRGEDYGNEIAVDASGYVYVTGVTHSIDFPFLNQYQGKQWRGDVFLSKIDPTQSGLASLVYSTCLGGSDFDRGDSIAVDNSGNAYVTGCTASRDFPVLNQYQTGHGSANAFLAKIDTTQSGASSLIYSTCLGGDDTDYAYGIAVDSSGNAYVTGVTYSQDFPTLNPYQSTFQGGCWDAFVTKIDTTQSGAASLVYSTYLGGRSYDHGHSIAVDNSGNAYVTGCTASGDFPIRNQYQPWFRGFTDAFVTKIDTTQSGEACLIYSTYIGGGNYDYGEGIAVDNSGCAYVTGPTESTDFPTLNPYQSTFQGGPWDAFVTKIDTTQSGAASFLYSTYLGGGDLDIGYDIEVDNRGCAYVTGTTYSQDFPTLNPFQSTFQGGYWDAFVTKIDTTQSGAASLVYSTYLGGEAKDRGYGVAADNSGNAYVTGYTKGTDFPTMNQYMADPGDGYWDAFVTKLAFAPIIITAPNGRNSWQIGTSRDITWISPDVTGDLKITLWQDGAHVGLIADGVDPASGYFPWSVGQHNGGTAPAGTGYSIKIKEIGAPVSDMSDAPFSLVELSLSSPNGGENWMSGSTENITWNASGVTANLKISLWKDGSFVGTIDNDVDPGTGSYAWTVGQHSGGTAPVGTGYTIKIKERGSQISDTSDVPFTINGITVTSPNGGENWTIGSNETITWDVLGVTGKVKISFWKDGSFLWTIDNDVDSAAGSYTWTVGQHSGGTAAAGTGYSIKIKAKGAPIADTSDAYFSLTN